MSLDLLNKVKSARRSLEGVTIVAPFASVVHTMRDKFKFTLPTAGTTDVGLHFWLVEDEAAHYVRSANPRETLDFYQRHIVVPGVIAQNYAFPVSSRLKRNRFPMDNVIQLNRLEDFAGFDFAFVGNKLVPIKRSRSLDRRILDTFKNNLVNRVERFHVPNAHKTLYEAYDFLLANTIPTVQERIQEVLDFSGALLLQYTELDNNQVRVTYRTGTGEYTSVFDLETLRVIAPGVCIQGDYNMYTLPALIDYGVENRLGDWSSGRAYRRST